MLERIYWDRRKIICSNCCFNGIDCLFGVDTDTVLSGLMRQHLNDRECYLQVLEPGKRMTCKFALAMSIPLSMGYHTNKYRPKAFWIAADLSRCGVQVRVILYNRSIEWPVSHQSDDQFNWENIIAIFVRFLLCKGLSLYNLNHVAANKRYLRTIL